MGGAAGVDSPAVVVFGDSGDAQTVVVQPTPNANLPTAGVYAGTLNLGAVVVLLILFFAFLIFSVFTI